MDSARLGTRTLELIHVASALALDADTFSAFDNNRKRLARATGLKAPQRAVTREGLGSSSCSVAISFL
jgi:hypothetical protein